MDATKTDCQETLATSGTVSVYGVFWSNRFGGICPACGRVRARVTSSPPWEGACKVRFHVCRCGHHFKSVEREDWPQAFAL